LVVVAVSNLKPTKKEITITAMYTRLGVQGMIKDQDFMMKMMNRMALNWEKKSQQEKKKE